MGRALKYEKRVCEKLAMGRGEMIIEYSRATIA